MLEEPSSSVQQPTTMRSRPRRRLTRREKWPLQVGLFLLYVLMQTTTSVYTTTTTPGTTTRPVTVHDQSLIAPGKGLQEAASIPEDKNTPMRKTPANGEPEKIDANLPTQAPTKSSLQTQKPLTDTPKDNKQQMGSITSTSETKLDSKVADKAKTTQSTQDHTEMPMLDTTMMNEARPTWRPRRENCSPPAIEQFPRPLVGPEARKHGALIIDILVAIYTFLGLAIVCDDYFVSSLDRICEELRLSPDVAGATFMAAGSSAPELATVVIGVFFAKDDIGVSGVIGSAVFNIMFVISVCGLFSGTVSKLNWWPLCRDCFFYMISILVMLGTIYNESISWPEALFMLFTYAVYCIVLSFNERLERWAKSLNLPYLPKDNDPAEENALVSYRSLQEERLSYTGPNSPVTDQIKGEGNMTGIQDSSDAAYPKPACPAQPQYYKAKEADPNEISPLVRPIDGGKWGLFSWGLVYPIHFMCRVTMPDCRQEKWKRWYPFTFCVSMIWISFYSYFMVWMITIIGSTLGIPDTVMGLTFVAAGVSVPDALSSLAVIKEGLGDMAVSNAVGSNVFDILVCLGLPWFIQTAMIAPGSHVNVTSRGLTYSTVSLLSTVVFLVLATHLNGWKLDRRYGVVLMVWYLIFIAFASLYELNVFGEMNPPVCPSKY